ncbi:hypothetical protein LTR97_009058 [Elasticomyces elasticus]|uniref:Uncharacterized protein n=1 Tax=Elasticomyces elasticus TaxID=574655 RepID=A0AAN7ZYN8_9PEZI|nr:hypothetical protein LTR97_009058 [Elasticomyces elasticus]
MSTTATTNSAGIALNTLAAPQAAYTAPTPSTSTQATTNVTITTTASTPNSPTPYLPSGANGSVVPVRRQWSAVNEFVSTWVRRSLAAATFAIAVYYAQRTMRLAIWTARHDYRGDCADDLSRGFTSPECEVTLARAALPPPVRERGISGIATATDIHGLNLNLCFTAGVSLLSAVCLGSTSEFLMKHTRDRRTRGFAYEQLQVLDSDPIANSASKALSYTLWYIASYLVAATILGVVPRTLLEAFPLIGQLYYRFDQYERGLKRAPCKNKEETGIQLAITVFFGHHWASRLCMMPVSVLVGYAIAHTLWSMPDGRRVIIMLIYFAFNWWACEKLWRTQFLAELMALLVVLSIALGGMFWLFWASFPTLVELG